MPFTDIEKLSWIERLPWRLRPFAYLMRLDRPIGIWLLLLPGLWAITLSAGGILEMNSHDWQIFGLFVIGAVIMRAAGCVVNDIADRNIDKKITRTAMRPLAAGTVSLRQAVIFFLLLLMCGFLILLQMNITTILLGFLVVPFIVIYPFMKRVTWWPQLFLGFTFNAGTLMGWSAITGILDIPALCLYGAGILWTLGYDTIYAHQDKEDDALAGIKSSALKLGEKSKKAVSIFYGASLLLFLAAALTAGGSIFQLALLTLAALHMVRQLRDWNPNDAPSSLATFKSNQNFGLLVLLATAL